MATYPIKILKDEEGTPIVPFTHMKAVAGLTYIWSPALAEKTSDGKYKITNNDLDILELNNKLIVVDFNDVNNVPKQSVLSLNNSDYYIIKDTDNIMDLDLSGYNGVSGLFEFTGSTWKLAKIAGVGTGGGGGHTIADENGNIMPQRIVLNFEGLDVVDSPGTGATKVISNAGWFMSPYTITPATIQPNTWVPLLTDTIIIPKNGYYRITVDI